MKKFFKIFLIILLVVACIAGTCFVFFKIFDNKKSDEVNYSQMIYSAEKAKFTKKVEFIDKCVNVEQTDSRFSNIMEVTENLDELLAVLNYSYVSNGFIVEDVNVTAQYNNLEKSQNLVNEIIAEYAKKCSTETIDVVINKDFNEINFTIFPKNIGANDLYVAMSDYLVNYAKFIQVVNSKTMNKVSNSDESAQFYFIDVYTRIVVNTFRELDEDRILNDVTDYTNMALINNICKNNPKFNLVENSFKKVALDFISNYSDCDKNEFCKNFSSNINSVKSISESSSAIQKATYYFKAVYGV